MGADGLICADFSVMKMVRKSTPAERNRKATIPALVQRFA